MGRWKLVPPSGVMAVALFATLASVSAQDGSRLQETAHAGRRLFDQETFGGNGRTCLTCHSLQTGTVSPEAARRRFRIDPQDPLFTHDGSDDEDGDGFGDGQHATRMLTDATILMRIPLHPHVTLKHDPEARFVTVRRGIPTTVNTPALDPVLMLDGRQPTLEDVLKHYQLFFAIASDLDGPGPEPPLIDLTERDQRDILSFLKLLD